MNMSKVPDSGLHETLSLEGNNPPSLTIHVSSVSPTACTRPQDAGQHVEKEKFAAHVNTPTKLSKTENTDVSSFPLFFLRCIWKALSPQFCGSRNVPWQDVHS